MDAFCNGVVAGLVSTTADRGFMQACEAAQRGGADLQHCHDPGLEGGPRLRCLFRQARVLCSDRRRGLRLSRTTRTWMSATMRKRRPTCGGIGCMWAMAISSEYAACGRIAASPRGAQSCVARNRRTTRADEWYSAGRWPRNDIAQASAMPRCTFPASAPRGTHRGHGVRHSPRPRLSRAIRERRHLRVGSAGSTRGARSIRVSLLRS